MMANCASAQELGAATAGMRFAGEACAECHAVTADESKSRHRVSKLWRIHRE
jgi:mono/diheme cytochrome c family protein